MDIFFKVAAGTLIAVILGMVVAKQEKNIALLLSIAGCCIILAAAMMYMEPVVDFLRELQQIGQMDPEMLGILLKTVGIGLLAEIVVLICNDAGNAALGKTLQTLSVTVVLWLAIPLLRSLLTLVQEILGGI